MRDPSKELNSGNEILERFKSEAASNCAPLFIEDLFLVGGHNASTRNATATFVMFEGKYYACTCRHVVELVQKRREAGYSPFPTLAPFFDKTYIPLSLLTAEGLKDAISIVAPGANEDCMDLAIADISTVWPQLSSIGKVAIDMNPESYREPRWARAQMLAAAGWPEVNKRNVIRNDGEERVFGTIALLVAEKNGDLDRHDRIVLMKSNLGNPHGWFFSGISGGPMFVIQEERLVPVALTFEGWPQTKDEPPHAELTDQDIMVRGLTLTPDNFRRWLVSARLKS